MWTHPAAESRLALVQEIRRPQDDELCGYVRGAGSRWQALTVFHGLLAEFDRQDLAVDHVAEAGLPALQQRWHYRPAPDEDWQVVLIQEAHPGRVRLALGYYSLPGVPVVTVTAADLEAGATLALRPTT